MNTAKMTSEYRKKVTALAKRMNSKNTMPVPLAGKLIDLIGGTVKPEDVDFLIRFGDEPRTAAEAEAMTGLPEDDARAYLDDLVKRGWIWPYLFTNGESGYDLMPIVVGWLELQLCHGRDTEREREFARKTNELFNSMKRLNFFPLRSVTNLLAPRLTKPYQSIGAIRPPDDPFQGGRIDVSRSVAVSPSTVQPTHYVSELIDRHGRDHAIAVVHCFCRQWRRFVNEPCRFDIRPETCIVVGPMARRIAEYEYGRIIEKKEALGILEEVSKAGAMHTLFHEKDDIRLPNVAICNCCWDCCGLYGGFNRGLFPLQFKCYYEARVTRGEECTGCRKCDRHCPTHAITLVDRKAVIDSSKCIGCGQCALQCPANSIALSPRRRDVFVRMPKLSEARIRAV